MHGKTYLIQALLSNLEVFMRDEDVERSMEILYTYNSVPPEVDRTIHMHQGLPSVPQIVDFAKKNKSKGTILVLDDMNETLAALPSKQQLAYSSFITDVSRKINCSIIWISQTLYNSKLELLRVYKTCSTAFILFHFPGDLRSVSRLAGQICPTDTKNFMKAYQDAISYPRGYLYCQLRAPGNNENAGLQLRNYIAPPTSTRLLHEDSPVFQTNRSFMYLIDC